jgi:uncharacterized protein (TIGR02001 family)
MKKPLFLASLLALSFSATAADSPLTGNITLTSDYKFRGYTQTNYKPALQGGFDYALPAGFYVGNWNSSIEQSLYGGASLESDLYGGFKGKIGALDFDVGAVHYMYPGSTGPKIDNTELYFGLSAGPFAAKLYYAITDYFAYGKIARALGNAAAPDTDGTIYVDLTANHDLGGGLTLNAHIGLLKLKGASYYGVPSTVTDYKIGVSKDFSGWVVGLAYLGTDEKDFALTGMMTGARAAGDAKALLSLTKTF